MEIKDLKLSYKKIFKQTYVTALRQGFSDYKDIPNNFLDKFENDFDKYFDELSSNPTIQMFLCYEKDEPIGVIVCGKSNIKNALETDAIIDSIYFKKDFCGKGFAQKAFDFVQNFLINSGYKRIVLWCSLENKRAWRFYEKNNFKPTNQKWDDNLDGTIYHNILLVKNF